MRALLGLAALAATLNALPVAAQAPLRVGYIDSQYILSETPGAQEAANQFETELTALRAQLQPAADSLDQMIQAYESQALTLSPEAKQRREQQIMERRESIQQRAGQLEAQAGQRRQELVQPVMDRISRVIEEIRVEGDYHIIFDSSAGSIIAADESLDLSEEVLRRLREQGTGTGN